MTERFSSTGDGRIRVGLEKVERALLRDLIETLTAARMDENDPGYQRLHPPVYLGDAPASQEWWRLMGGQLDEERTSDRRLAVAGLDAEDAVISGEDAEALLRVTNEGRLLLAARFGVEVEEDYDGLEPGQQMILGFLAAIVDELTIELTRSLG